MLPVETTLALLPNGTEVAPGPGALSKSVVFSLALLTLPCEWIDILNRA